jgi:hypothetical protein
VTLNTVLDRIFVLNLPRSVDRRQHIVHSFARLRISNYEFIEAVDGRNSTSNRRRVARGTTTRTET